MTKQEKLPGELKEKGKELRWVVSTSLAVKGRKIRISKKMQLLIAGPNLQMLMRMGSMEKKMQTSFKWAKLMVWSMINQALKLNKGTRLPYLLFLLKKVDKTMVRNLLSQSSLQEIPSVDKRPVTELVTILRVGSVTTLILLIITSHCRSTQLDTSLSNLKVLQKRAIMSQLLKIDQFFYLCDLIIVKIK
jgi:hypothetical protein